MDDLKQAKAAREAQRQAVAKQFVKDVEAPARAALEMAGLKHQMLAGNRGGNA